MRASRILQLNAVAVAIAGSLVACSPTSDGGGQSHAVSESPEGGAGPSPATPETMPATKTPERLKSFAEIRDALLGGFRVRSYVNYRLCKKDGAPGVDATSSAELETFELQAPASGPSFIDVSKTKLAWIYFTDGYEYLWDYGRIRFNEDGTSTVRAQYYKPGTYTQVVDEEFACELDTDGAASTTKGMSVFKDPATPRHLETFPDLMATLNGGGAAHALIDLSRCQKLENKVTVGPGPNVVEKVPFSLTEYFGKNVVGNPDAYVATSETTLHLESNDEITNRYTKLRVTAAGDASVLIMRNKPAGLEQVESSEYSCPIATTAKPVGVSLFGF